MTDDDDELQRVWLLLVAKQEVLHYLQRAVLTENAADAAVDIRLAGRSVKTFVQRAKNLIASRYKGTQAAIKLEISGQMIGLEAKIRELLCSEEGSADAALHEKIKDVIEFLLRAAVFLKVKAGETENLARNPEYCARQKRFQRYVPTLGDAMRWLDLSSKVSAMAAKLDGVLIDLKRARRMVKIGDKRNFRTEPDTAADAKHRPTRRAA